MGFYDRRILPHMIDCLCSMAPIMELRSKVVPRTNGVVLEVGMGSGINLSLYDPAQVEYIWGLEPSEGMRVKAQPNLQRSELDVRWLDLPGEEIPLDDNSIDTVLLTYTLCTIPDWQAALTQMKRVLKPSGQLLFCEHGRSPDDGVARWQDRLTPLWKVWAGGCYLNRPVASFLEQGGFCIEELDSFYMEQTPKVAGYMSYGRAVHQAA